MLPLFFQNLVRLVLASVTSRDDGQFKFFYNVFLKVIRNIPLTRIAIVLPYVDTPGSRNKIVYLACFSWWLRCGCRACVSCTTVLHICRLVQLLREHVFFLSWRSVFELALLSETDKRISSDSLLNQFKLKTISSKRRGTSKRCARNAYPM